MNSDETVEIENEFARVRVGIDNTGNGPRLRIASVYLNRTVFLDPLQLESLTWSDIGVFSRFLSTPFGPEAEPAGHVGVSEGVGLFQAEKRGRVPA